MDTLDVGEESSQRIVSSIIDRFLSCGLITEDRRNELIGEVEDKRAEIYKLLAENDPATGEEMLKIIRSVESDEQEALKLNLEKGNVAMQTDVIIKEMLSYLNLADIKRCRNVCKKWQKVAEPQFRKLSKIVFLRIFEKDAPIDDFIEAFSNSGINVPFTSFKFQNHDSYWTITEITNFLETQKANIKELEFNSVTLMEEKKRARPFDISNWIVNLPLQLKVLTINGMTDKSSHFKIPLHNLHSIQEINLRGCRVIVGAGDGEKIAPCKLILHGIDFYRDGKLLFECHINDYVDFKRIFSLRFLSPSRSISLDLLELTNVDYLSLTFIKMINFDTSKCNVRHLHLKIIPFTACTEMKIQELTFSCSLIDLAVLPPDISKLTLDRAKIKCNGTLKMSSLKWLELKRFNKFFFLKYFKQCHELEKVAIAGREKDAEVDLNLLPKSVTKLKLTKIGEIVSKLRFELKLLVLDGFSSIPALDAVSTIRSDFVVLKPDFRNDSKEVQKMTYDYYRGSDFARMVYHINEDWDKGVCRCSKCDSII